MRLELPGEEARTLGLRGDHSSLGRALRNLIDNAVAHSPKAGVMRVEAELVRGTLELAVSDEGEGVAPEEAVLILTPFYRGAKEQATEGARLGLAIARDIARSHGGDVVVDLGHRGGGAPEAARGGRGALLHPPRRARPALRPRSSQGRWAGG